MPAWAMLLGVPSICSRGMAASVWSAGGTISGCLQVGQVADRPANSGLTWNFMPQLAHQKAIMEDSRGRWEGLSRGRSARQTSPTVARGSTDARTSPVAFWAAGYEPEA